MIFLYNWFNGNINLGVNYIIISSAIHRVQLSHLADACYKPDRWICGCFVYNYFACSYIICKVKVRYNSLEGGGMQLVFCGCSHFIQRNNI